MLIVSQRLLAQDTTDLDRDGLHDRLEDSLANLYAPAIIHDKSEKYFPTSVDTYLKNSRLRFYDDECDLLWDGHENDYEMIMTAPKQEDLIHRKFDKNFCGSDQLVYSDNTLSIRKQRTFYLEDVPDGYKAGASNPIEWITYFHAYRNIHDGITVQYWRFYAFNGLPPVQYLPEQHRAELSKLRKCCHGGDWECVQVVLDSSYRPLAVRLLGHTQIFNFKWEQVVKSHATHPLIYAVVEGHTSILATGNEQGIIQETFNGGAVHYQDGTTKQGGGLVNVGEKCYPMNNQFFVQYSGLWGSPGLLYETSGYWGPAFNETDRNAQNNFISAWGMDMKESNKVCGRMKECFPLGVSR